MRTVWILSITALLLAANAWCDEPVPPAKPTPVGDLSVLVLPFTPIGEAKADWVGQAVQQNVLSELSRVTGVMPITPTTRPSQVLDLKSAKAEADKAGAAIVLYGTYQSTEEGVRLTGQLLDARNGRFIGGVKATGTMKEIFAVEDAASDQVKRILTQHRAANQPQVAIAPPAAPAPVAPVAPPPQAQAIPQVWPWDLPNAFVDHVRDRVYSDDYYPSYYNYTYSSGFYGYPFGLYTTYPSWSGFHHHHGRSFGPTFFPGGVMNGPATFFPGGVVRW
jgi:TolB-like protein